MSNQFDPKTHIKPKFITPESHAPKHIFAHLEKVTQSVTAFTNHDHPIESRKFLRKVNYYLQQIDSVIKPLDHFSKVVSNPDLLQTLKDAASIRLTLLNKILNSRTFKYIMHSQSEISSDTLLNRFRSKLSVQAQHNGIGLDPAITKSVKAINESLVAAKSDFRQKITCGNSLCPDFEKIVSSNPCRDIRRKIWMKRYTINSTGNLDTRDLIIKQLQLRHELAEILGYDSFVDLALTERSMTCKDQLSDFLDKCGEAIIPAGRTSLEKLRVKSGLSTLEPWDGVYFLKKYSPDVSCYFELWNTVKSTVKVIEDLFDLRYKENSSLPVWNSEVKIFDVYDRSGKILGRQYLDLIRRPGQKTIGAWKSSIFHGSTDPEQPQLPVCGLQCNFPQSEHSEPVLLSWNQVKTLFHEFGHCLHELCCCLPLSTMGGTQVERDILEFPSSYLELLPQHPAIITRLGKHWKTGKTIPREIIETLFDYDHWTEPFHLLRRLKLAMFDFHIHSRKVNSIAEIHDCYLWSEKKYGLTEIPQSAWPETSFHHIFAGDYAVGYYGYLYARMLAKAVAKPLFHCVDPFKSQYLKDFREAILSKGNSKNMLDLIHCYAGFRISHEELFESLN